MSTFVLLERKEGRWVDITEIKAASLSEAFRLLVEYIKQRFTGAVDTSEQKINIIYLHTYDPRLVNNHQEPPWWTRIVRTFLVREKR